MNIYLIGYRGCGKSSVGPLLAKQLGWTSIDSDTLVEADSGRTIAQIFAKDGENEFRQREQNVISRSAKQTHQVISLGGGAIMLRDNQEAIANAGKSVWLTAPAEVLWERITADAGSTTRRPNLTEDGGIREVRDVLAVRASVYGACADYTVDTQHLSAEQVADKIFRWWQTVDT